MSMLDSSAPTQLKPVSKPTPTLSDLSSSLPTPEELAQLLPPESYIIEGFLGQGGMGAVYRAVQISLNRPVAIKIMPLAIGVEFDFADRFRREAQSMASLNHPGIISVFDFGTAGKFLYIVMEYVDGSDLHQVLKAKQMTPDLALWLMPAICDAVAAAHEHGIIHRDIKPANILLTRDWRVKVADFGLAKRQGSTDTLVTQANLGLGTPDYAAPEQFDTSAPVDHRADIYALGVTFYQMLTGQLPRGAWSPPSMNVGTDARLDAVLVRAMSPKPEHRFQSAREFAQAIIGFQQTLAWEHQQRAAAAQTAQGPKPAKASPARPSAKIDGASSASADKSKLALIAAAAVVLGILGFVFLRPTTPPADQAIGSTLPTALPAAALPSRADPKPSQEPKPDEGKPTSHSEPPLPSSLPSISDYVPDQTGWTKVDLASLKAEPNVTPQADGSMSFSNGFLWSQDSYPGSIAVRATFRNQPGQKNLRLYARAKGTAHAYAINAWGGGNPSFDLSLYQGDGYKPTSLGGAKITPGATHTTLELRCEGEEISALLQGKQVARRTDPIHKQGKFGIFADSGILESMHYQLLDTRGRALATSPAKPDLKPSRLPDATRWLPVWTEQELKSLPKGWEWQAGRLSGTSAATRSTNKPTDAAIRAICLVGEKEGTPALVLRAGAEDTVITSIERSTKSLSISQKNGQPGSAQERVADLPIPDLTDGEHRLEVALVGSVLGITFDGSYLAGVTLPYPPKAGALGVYAPNGRATLREVEWQSLDPDATQPMPQLAKLPDPAKWKPVFPAAYLKEGKITFPPVNNMAPPDVMFINGAVRVQVPNSELDKGLNIRVRTMGGSCLQAEFGNLGGYIRRIWKEGTIEKSEKLIGYSIKPASNPLRISIVAFENTVGVFANELLLASALLPEMQAGLVSFYGKDATLLYPEWQSLDPAPEAAPKDAIDLQLEKLAAEYQAEFDKLGGLTFQTAYATLNAQFAAALDRAAAQAQQRGQLDDVLTLQSEAKRMKEAPSVPELDDDSTPAVLKPLYATYRKSLAKLTADRDARTKPALQAHQKKLTAYQAQLTKAGDIPGALKVKDALAKLTNPEPSPSPSAAEPTTAATTSSRGGKLRGWGEIKSQPIDFSKTNAYSDIIEVIGKESGFMALRADGSVIGTWDAPAHKVSRLRQCDAHLVFIGPKAITFRFNHLGSETIEASTWGGGGVRDCVTAIGGVYLIAREDGTLRMRDTKNHKGRDAVKPNEASKLLRDITGVTQLTSAGNALFALTDQGRVHGWLTPNRRSGDAEAEGNVAPLDVSGLPKGIKTIWGTGSATSTMSLYVLTQAGSVSRYDFTTLEPNLAQNATLKDLPPEGSVAELGINTRLLWVRLKSGERILVSSLHDLAVQVKEHSASPDIFPFHFPHDDPVLGKLNSSYVLWIE